MFRLPGGHGCLLSIAARLIFMRKNKKILLVFNQDQPEVLS